MNLLETIDPEEVAVLSSIVTSQLLGIHDSEGSLCKSDYIKKFPDKLIIA